MEPKVALVSMPWTCLTEPSLGLAILKAQLINENIAARVFHSNIRLLKYLKASAYEDISKCYALNEFVFTSVLDEGLSSTQANTLASQCTAYAESNVRLALRGASQFGKTIIKIRHDVVPQYLAECAEEILAYEPTMIGFTCLFDQTLASAALASLLRQSRPKVLIVFGGYALEGPPGLEVIRAFPQIDAVAVGDGEPIVGALAQASVGARTLDSIPGVITRTHAMNQAKTAFQLESSPIPDYSDWFQDLSALEQRDKVKIQTTGLPVETSRGCWWGQRQHCVFCGIDEATLIYREKKAETVLSFLNVLRNRHGNGIPFRFADYILPHTFIKTLLPLLAQVRPPYELTCELKANQNPDSMKALARAGFSDVQPGIESFDSNVLKLMHKGVTGIHNVLCLKLGFLNRIVINYNILFGFPGEQPEWYKTMLSLLPRIFHLTPPVSRTEVIVTRFAPLHSDPKRFGAAAPPRHHRGYDVLFSDNFLNQTGFSLDNYAYYFERYFQFGSELRQLHQELVNAIDQWKRQHHLREIELGYELKGDAATIYDSRSGKTREILLDPLQTMVYLACDTSPRSARWIAGELSLTDLQVRQAIEVLDNEGLVWKEEDLVIGLAIPTTICESYRKTEWKKRWASLYP